MSKSERYPLESSIPYMMYRIVNKLNQNIHDRLRPAGLTLSMWRLLSSLKARGTCTVSELASCTVMQQAVVSRILTEMEEKQLVKRQPSKDDQRVVRIKLTPKGEQLFEIAAAIAEEHRNHALKGFSATETTALLGMLRTVQKNIGIEWAPPSE